MANAKNHSPDAVVANLDGINISGYADDTFIEVERNEDAITLYVGAGGEYCRSRSLNKSGTVTFTLMATSSVNDLLAAMAQLDEDTGTGYGPLLIKDLNGTMLVSAAEAWIKKRPKIERAREAGTIQWVIECGELIVFEGGNL